MEDDYYEALYKCFMRYNKMLSEYCYWESNSNNITLQSFILQCQLSAENKDVPLMKMNRWLGYIQGCLINSNITTIETERDWTRSLFRPLDFPEEK